MSQAQAPQAALLHAAIALLASATALLVLFLLIAPGQPEPPAGATPSSRSFTGSDFRAAIGKAGRDGRKLEIHALEGGRALFVRRASMRASDYAFLRFEIENFQPDQVAYLVWRTSETGNRLFNQRLKPSGDTGGVARLSRSPEWQGNITEIGIDFYGSPGQSGTRLATVEFLPYTRITALQALWKHWRETRVWDQTSINNLSAAAPGEMSPAWLAALWWLLALLALCASCVRRGDSNWLAAGFVTAVPWILLDMLWQQQLGEQLAHTRQQFSGKNQHERHLADTDGALYAYAHHLQSNVLPTPGPRIHLLYSQQEEEIHNYHRIRLQYHLLPHNIFNYGALPRFRYLRNGDYLLVLGEVADLIHDPAGQALHWGGWPRIPAVLVDKHPRGSVYRVTGEVQYAR